MRQGGANESLQSVPTASMSLEQHPMPKLPQPEPPHPVHRLGQQYLPLSDSTPGISPLPHVDPAIRSSPSVAAVVVVVVAAVVVVVVPPGMSVAVPGYTVGMDCDRIRGTGNIHVRVMKRKNENINAVGGRG